MTVTTIDDRSVSVSIVRRFSDYLTYARTALWSVLHPLEAELCTHGIVSLPRSRVRKHMRDLLNEERPLWIGLLVSFWNPFVQTTVGATLIVTLAAFGCVTLAEGVLFRDVALLLPGLALLALPILFGISLGILHVYEATGRTGVGARWEYFLLGKIAPANATAHIVTRMRQTARVRGVIFEEARFNADPIVFACRHRWFGLSYERVPIGAYNTGTDLDRM